jgi:fluoride exporter
MSGEVRRCKGLHSVGYSVLMQSTFSPSALAAVAAGGAAGSVARYVIGMMVQRMASGLPFGTLFVNVTGSFALGLLATWLFTRGASPELRLLLTIGVCGGYTTFSTFAYESALMLQDGRLARFALYAFLSVILTIAAMFAGFSTARAILR